MIRDLRVKIGRLLGLAGIALLFPMASSAAANLVSLSIGVSEYSSPLQKLKYPTLDAEAVAKTLGKFGFKSLLVTEPDVDEFHRAITEFLAASKNADAAVLFYAGHGLQVNGVNYFVPRDADFRSEKDFERVLVTVDAVLEQLDKSGARFKFFIVDACRNNPFSSDTTIRFPPGLAELRQLKENTLVTYASAPGQTSMEFSALQHGLYSSSLIDVWDTADRIEARSLTEQTRDRVLKFGEAHPQLGMQVPWESNSMRGPFYFVRTAGREVTKFLPETPKAERDFVFPKSDREEIRPQELRSLSHGELRIARNEIYARKGRMFVSPDLQKYFSQFRWYRGVSAEVSLNATEAANVALILAAERNAPAEIAIERPTADFVFPDSDRRRLTPGDIARLSRKELQIARNEIFARHGRFFQTEQLRVHFERFPWYKPYTWNPGLNAIEWDNVALIAQAERGPAEQR